MEEQQLQVLASNCELCVTKPCQVGCPLNNDITEFIRYIKEKQYESAFLTMKKTSVLLPICGRVCEASEQCKKSCVKGVSFNPVQIKELEKFIGDMGLEYSWNIPVKEEGKYKVAVIGSGPASLTCAAFLRRYGVDVTIFEKHSYLGGLLSHGIPEFRLQKEIVNKTIASILNEGIKVEYNKTLGKDFFLSNLEKEYDAIFLGIGANESKKIDIKGSKKTGVYYANEFLEEKVSLDFNNKTVIVFGGGNTAIDIARIAKENMAKKIYVIYRKKEEQLSAFKSEVESAKEEEIEFLFETIIKEIKGKHSVEKVTLQRTSLEDDKLILVENSEIDLKCDYVFLALGSKTSEEISSLGLELTEENKIKINLMGQTSNPKIYAGGDVAGIKSTVAHASRSGRNAAYAILKEHDLL